MFYVFKYVQQPDYSVISHQIYPLHVGVSSNQVFNKKCRLIRLKDQFSLQTNCQDVPSLFRLEMNTSLLSAGQGGWKKITIRCFHQIVLKMFLKEKHGEF